MFNKTDGWTRCPRGELQQLAGRLRVRRQLRTVLSVLAAVLITALVCGLVPLATALIANSGSQPAASCGTAPDTSNAGDHGSTPSVQNAASPGGCATPSP